MALLMNQQSEKTLMPAGVESKSRRWRSSLIALGLYGVATLAATWPLVVKLSSHLAGDHIDVWINPWANWWIRKVLSEGLELYHTEYLFWPRGATLHFHSFSHFNSLLALLLEPMTGAVAAQNITTLINYLLTALGMYLLVKHLTRDRLAAFISGYVFSFSPWNLWQSCHPVISTVQWIPLFILCLIRTVEERSSKWAVGAAVFIWMAALSSWYLLVFALLLGGLYLAVLLLSQPNILHTAWRSLICMVVASALLIVPLIYPVAGEYLSGQDYVATSPSGRSVDLLGLVVPSIHHPVFGRYLEPLFGHLERAESVFVGWAILALSIYATVVGWRRTHFWSLALVLFLVISVGPYPRVGGVRYEQIHFPWGDPIARFFRAPYRFFVVVSLSSAVLAGYGLAHLIARASGSRWRQLIVWVLAGLAVFEFQYAPFPLTMPSVPSFYEQIAAEPGEFAVLDLPMGRRRQYMYYQTIHGRPLVEGTISRTPTDSWEYIESNPFLGRIRAEEVMDPTLTDTSRQLMALAQDGIRYLIIHPQKIGPEILEQWCDYLIVPPLYDGEDLLVYRTDPPHGAPPTLVHEWEEGVGLVRAEVESPSDLSQGSVVAVDVHWLATRSMSQDLTAVLSLRDTAGETTGSAASAISPDWPTSQWPTDAVAADRYSFQLDPFLSPGSYSLALSVGEETASSHSDQLWLQHVEVEPLPRVFEMPSALERLDVDFGGQMLLLGYDLRRAEDHLTLTLHWQAMQRMDESYKVFVHLVNDDTGEIAVQDDAVPRRWTYPTTWWEAGEVVSDEIPLAVGDILPGAYTLAVGVYAPDGERLVTDTGDSYLVLEASLLIP